MNIISNNGIKTPKTLYINQLRLDGQLKHKHVDNNDNKNNLNISHKNSELINFLDCVLVKINGKNWYKHKDDIQLKIYINGYSRSEEGDYLTCNKIYPFMARETFEYMNDFLMSMFNTNVYTDFLFFPFKIYKSDMPTDCRRLNTFEICLVNAFNIDSIDIFYFGRDGLFYNEKIIDSKSLLPYEKRNSELIINSTRLLDLNSINSRIMIQRSGDIITQIILITEFKSDKMLDLIDIYFDSFQVMMHDNVILNIPCKYIFDYYKDRLGLDINNFCHDNKVIIPICLEELTGLEYLLSIHGDDIYLQLNVRHPDDVWNRINDKQTEFNSYDEFLALYDSNITVKSNYGYMDTEMRNSLRYDPYTFNYLSIEPYDTGYKMIKRLLNKLSDNMNTANIKCIHNGWFLKVFELDDYEIIYFNNDIEMDYDNMKLGVEI